MKKIKTYYIEICILLMPIIDALNTLLNVNISLVYRGFFLCLMGVSFLLNSKKQKNRCSFIYLSVLFFYSLLYVYHYYNFNGTFFLKTELVTLIKFLYMPLVFIFYYNHNKSNDIKSDKTFNIMFIVGIEYIVLMIIPFITGTSLKSYTYRKLGYSGWFYSPNELGAVFAALLPFFLYKIVKKPKSIISVIIIILFLISTFLLGTKTPVIALLLSLFFFLFVEVLRLFLKKGNKLVIIELLFFVILSVLIYNNSYLKNNIENQLKGYENSDKIKTNKKTPAENYKLVNFPNYKVKIQKKDSKVLNLIFSTRNIWLQENINKMKSTPYNNVLFGLTLGATTLDPEINNMSEIDFFDIFMYYGVIGFIILFGYIMILMVLFLVKILIKFKVSLFNDELIAPLLSSLLLLFVSSTAGHVLSAPTVSLFLVLNLCILTKILKIDINIKSVFIKRIMIFSFFALFLVSLIILFISKDKTFDIFIIKKNKNIVIDKDNTLVEKRINEGKDFEDTLYYYILDDYKNIGIVYVSRKIDDSIIEYYTIINNQTFDIKVEIETENNSNNFYYIPEINAISYNKMSAKKLLQKEENNNIMIVKSNTYLDRVEIKDHENDEWLSFNGHYVFENGIFVKSFINSTEFSENNILKKNYLTYLHSYSTIVDKVILKDYIDKRYTDFIPDNSYIDSQYSLKTANDLLNNEMMGLNTIQDLGNKIVKNYDNNIFINTGNGVVFTEEFIPTFKSQVCNSILLIKNYEINKKEKFLSIAKKLLMEIDDGRWIHNDTIYEYIDEDKNYFGETIIDNEIIDLLKQLDVLIKSNNLDYSINEYMDLAKD